MTNTIDNMSTQGNIPNISSFLLNNKIDHPSIMMQDHAEKRPMVDKMASSVDFQDTDKEGKPTIYLFIFVNPLSGDQKGGDLVDLPIQHFRMRRFPQVQVEIHNILNDKDRNLGIENIRLVQSMVAYGKVPPVAEEATKTDTNTGNI